MFVNSLTFVTFIVVHDSFFYMVYMYVCPSMFAFIFHYHFIMTYFSLGIYYIVGWHPFHFMYHHSLTSLFHYHFCLYPIYYIYFCTRCFCFEFQITSFLKLCNGNHMPAAVCHNIGSQVFIIVCI